MNKPIWDGKKVLITGHTGFKGAWLSLVLKKFGSNLFGYSLPPKNDMCVYSICNLEAVFEKEIFHDISDYATLSHFISENKPDFIFHMAAQPLVRKSYSNPAETFFTNVVGTLNLLEAVRLSKRKIPLINVTSDKVYENLNLGKSFKEDDKLGGNDPYSASKACSELVTSSYGKSFSKDKLFVNTVRAGNVIGGGDYSEDRIIPDCVKAISTKVKLEVRYKNAVRPWQHVLEPLFGYMLVCEQLNSQKMPVFHSWNFGPKLGSMKTVENILEYLDVRYSDFDWTETSPQIGLEEAHLLSVDTQKARENLGWVPKWGFEETLKETFDWYDAAYSRKNMLKFTEAQIEKYISAGK